MVDINNSEDDFNLHYKRSMLLTNKTPKKVQPPLQLSTVKPKTINQNKIFKEFQKGKHIFIHGVAGTGKTYLSLYLALDAVINQKKYQEAIIIRSTVPSRKQGFLPGTAQEKDEIYELPYDAIVTELFDNSTAYRTLKNTFEKIDFMSTSYLRGLTFRDAIILVDEVQNMNEQEINTIITRVGENCKVIICGDTRQDDLTNANEQSCIGKLRKIIPKMPSFSAIEMQIEDICRGDVIREWIIAQDQVDSENASPRFLKG